jgi:hypothetical protein
MGLPGPKLVLACVKKALGVDLYAPYRHLGLGTEFRSEKIPRNRLGMISVIPRKKVLIPMHSDFRARASSEARNGTESC